MGEFDETTEDTMDISEIEAAELPDTNDWDLFDDTDINVRQEDINPGLNIQAENGNWGCELEEELNPSEAEKAADYARSLGFEKAADYIERHYDGDVFNPDNPIPITTRNMTLEGKESDNGVSFERRTAELTDGLSVEGVFPAFDSRHHVELGKEANNMTLHQQFSACRDDLQEHMYDNPDKIMDLPVGAMRRMELPHGYTPEGYTWQHNPETGSFDLVSKDDHSVGHTGGNALWGAL